MHYLWMELNGIPVFLRHFHSCYRADRSMACHSKALRGLLNIICMAHPADRLCRYIRKQLGGRVNIHLCLSVLADRGCCHLSAQQVCHQLCAIADSQNRNTQFKDFF